MFRNKKWMKINMGFALAILLLTSYLFCADTIAEGETKDEVTVLDKDYETIVVNFSSYTEKSALKDVEWIFTKSSSLTLNGDQGTLVEYLTSSGDLVKKGDPILSYQAPYDVIAIEEMKLSLEGKESAYIKEAELKKGFIEEQQNKLQRMDYSSLEAQILALNIKKLNIEYKQNQSQTDKSLKELRAAIDEKVSDMELQYLLAPYDGVVFTSDNRKEGMLLDPYGELASIYDTKSAVLGTTVNGPNKFWYNMEVVVTGISNMKEDKTNIHKGKVVAVDSLLNGKASTGKIFITLEEENLFETMQRGNITAETVSIDGVLVIPVKVVKFENDMAYVYMLDQNNDVRKQYITGRDNGTDMWVYSGLSEGQRIVVE